MGLDPTTWGLKEILGALFLGNQVAGDPAGISKPQLSEEQKQLYSVQKQVADFMLKEMQRRSRLTLREGEGGNLEGPLVEALNMALGQANQAQVTPRLRLQAPSFNPFGSSQMQTFGASTPQLAPVNLQIPGRSSGSDAGGGTLPDANEPVNPPPVSGGYPEVFGSDPTKSTPGVKQLLDVLAGMLSSVGEKAGNTAEGTGNLLRTGAGGVEDALGSVVDRAGQVPEQVGNLVSSGGQAVGNAAVKLPEIIQQGAGGVIDFLSDVGRLGVQGVQQAPGVIQQGAGGVMDFAGDVGRLGVQGAQQVPDLLRQGAGGVEDFLGSVVGSAAQVPGAVQSGFSSGGQVIGNAVAQVPNLIQQGVSSGSQAIGNAAAKIPDLVRQGAGGVDDFLGSLVGQAGQIPSQVGNLISSGGQAIGNAVAKVPSFLENSAQAIGNLRPPDLSQLPSELLGALGQISMPSIPSLPKIDVNQKMLESVASGLGVPVQGNGGAPIVDVDPLDAMARGEGTGTQTVLDEAADKMDGGRTVPGPALSVATLVDDLLTGGKGQEWLNGVLGGPQAPKWLKDAEQGAGGRENFVTINTIVNQNPDGPLAAVLQGSKGDYAKAREFLDWSMAHSDLLANASPQQQTEIADYFLTYGNPDRIMQDLLTPPPSYFGSGSGVASIQPAAPPAATSKPTGSAVPNFSSGSQAIGNAAVVKPPSAPAFNPAGNGPVASEAAPTPKPAPVAARVSAADVPRLISAAKSNWTGSTVDSLVEAYSQRLVSKEELISAFGARRADHIISRAR